MKSIKAVVLTLIIAISIGAVAHASQPQNIWIVVGGEEIEIEATPIYQDGIVYAPVREVFEKLGFTVEWIDSVQSVRIYNDDISIGFMIGSPMITTRETARNFTSAQMIEAPSQIINGNVFIPVSAIEDVFVQNVISDGTQQMVVNIANDFVADPYRPAWETHPSFWESTGMLLNNIFVIIALIVIALIHLLVFVTITPHKAKQLYLCLGSVVVFCTALVAFYLTEKYISPFALTLFLTDTTPALLGFGFIASFYNWALGVAVRGMPYLIFWGQLIVPIAIMRIISNEGAYQEDHDVYPATILITYSIMSFIALAIFGFIVFFLMWLVHFVARGIAGVIMMIAFVAVLLGSMGGRNIIVVRSRH